MLSFLKKLFGFNTAAAETAAEAPYKIEAPVITAEQETHVVAAAESTIPVIAKKPRAKKPSAHKAPRAKKAPKA